MCVLPTTHLCTQRLESVGVYSVVPQTCLRLIKHLVNFQIGGCTPALKQGKETAETGGEPGKGLCGWDAGFPRAPGLSRLLCPQVLPTQP